MDFFRAQEEARRKTGLLVFYFLLAVVLIILAVYVAALLLAGGHGSLWRPQLFLLALGGTLLLVGGGTLYKVAALASGGGVQVAESLGGRRLSRETADPAERRLLNVVDEMAIASGVPVPPVYVLDAETSINAFAAGDSPGDAVVAVTRGTLEQLSRDELQGVIGHEFSHILNGDMRLNLRLIGVLFGILLLAIAGRVLVEGGSRGRGRNGAGAVALGLALLIIGYVGVFFGRLIKAAVSRQREFLADASAVQFTRNPSGIAGALKRIAGPGSRISHPRAEEASHLFFGEGIEFLFGWFATHPPIEERIRRIDPAFIPGEPGPVRSGTAAGTTETGDIRLEPQAFAAGAGTLSGPHMDYAQQLLAGLPPELLRAVRQPAGARYVVYGLLLSGHPPIASAQLEMIRDTEGVDGRAAVAALRAPLAGAGDRARLPLADLALPVLQQLDPLLRERFLRTTDRLVRADRRLDLFEYTLQHIFLRNLGPAATKAAPSVRDVAAIRDDCALLLSALAYAGNRGEAAQAAFEAAAALAPLEGPWQRVARDGLGLQQVDAALARLGGVPPRFKRRLVAACAAAVISDGQISVAEAELLRAVCEALEVPMPPLLP